MSNTTVNVGVLGCGNVGAALLRLVAERGDEIATRSGVRLVVTRVAVRSLSRRRPIDIADDVLTRDAEAVASIPMST